MGLGGAIGQHNIDIPNRRIPALSFRKQKYIIGTKGFGYDPCFHSTEKFNIQSVTKLFHTAPLKPNVKNETRKFSTKMQTYHTSHHLIGIIAPFTALQCLLPPRLSFEDYFVFHFLIVVFENRVLEM